MKTQTPKPVPGLPPSSPNAERPAVTEGLRPSRLVTHGPAIVWMIAAAAVTLVFTWGSSFHLYVGGIVIIYAISALGLEWLMGRTGQVSLGNAALMAVGAYTTAIVAPESWAPFPVPIVISALVGAVIGFIVGLPALRLRGVYLALATLALHFIVVFAADRYQKDTGSISGLSVPVAEIGGVRLRAGAIILRPPRDRPCGRRVDPRQPLSPLPRATVDVDPRE